MTPSRAPLSSDSGPPGDRRSPDPRRALGRHGESLAAEHLERSGFAILDRNVRTRKGEIDLIAFDGRVLSFVEVKTRRIRVRGATVSGRTTQADMQGPGTMSAALASSPAPLEGLRHRQRKRLRLLAAAWLRDRSPAPRAQELRFDAIGVLVDQHDRLLRLDHVEGAW